MIIRKLLNCIIETTLVQATFCTFRLLWKNWSENVYQNRCVPLISSATFLWPMGSSPYSCPLGSVSVDTREWAVQAHKMALGTLYICVFRRYPKSCNFTLCIYQLNEIIDIVLCAILNFEKADTKTERIKIDIIQAGCFLLILVTFRSEQSFWQLKCWMQRLCHMFWCVAVDCTNTSENNLTMQQAWLCSQ